MKAFPSTLLGFLLACGSNPPKLETTEPKPPNAQVQGLIVPCAVAKALADQLQGRADLLFQSAWENTDFDLRVRENSPEAQARRENAFAAGRLARTWQTATKNCQTDLAISFPPTDCDQLNLIRAAGFHLEVNLEVNIEKGKYNSQSELDNAGTLHSQAIDLSGKLVNVATGCVETRRAP